MKQLPSLLPIFSRDRNCDILSSSLFPLSLTISKSKFSFFFSFRVNIQTPRVTLCTCFEKITREKAGKFIEDDPSSPRWRCISLLSWNLSSNRENFVKLMLWKFHVNASRNFVLILSPIESTYFSFFLFFIIREAGFANTISRPGDDQSGQGENGPSSSRGGLIFHAKSVAKSLKGYIVKLGCRFLWLPFALVSFSTEIFVPPTRRSCLTVSEQRRPGTTRRIRRHYELYLRCENRLSSRSLRFSKISNFKQHGEWMINFHGVHEKWR